MCNSNNLLVAKGVDFQIQNDDAKHAFSNSFPGSLSFFEIGRTEKALGTRLTHFVSQDNILSDLKQLRYVYTLRLIGPI